MYERYYAMRSKAFPCQPTPEVFYQSSIHKGALFYLKSGIEEREPFLLITGHYGMGKTLLALRLAEMLDEMGLPYIDASTPLITYRELLKRLLAELDLTAASETETDLRAALFNHYKELAAEKKSLIIILDEVQDLGIKTLAKVRMLSNFSVDGHYPFTFVFFSHPAIVDQLTNPELESLNQRIRRRFHLSPFELEETKEYIYFRLLESGASGSPFFPDESIEVVHETSRGIPRFINNICDSSLLIGAARNLDTIEPAIVREAAQAIASQIAMESETAEASSPETQDNRPPPPAPQNDLDAAETPTTAPPRRGGVEFEDLQTQDDPGPRKRGIAPLSSHWWDSKFAWTAIIAVLVVATLYIVRNRDSIRSTLGLSEQSPAVENNNQQELPHNHQAELNKRDELTLDSVVPTPTPKPKLFSYTDILNEEAPLDAEDPSSVSNQDLLSVQDMRLADAPIYSESKKNLRDLRLHQRPQPGDNSTASGNSQPYRQTFPEQTDRAIRAAGLPTASRTQPSVSPLDQALAMGGSYSYSLLMHATPYYDEAVTMRQVWSEEGVPEVFVVETRTADGTPQWKIYQGFYRNQEVARQATAQLQLDATAEPLPYALRVVGVGGDPLATIKKLQSARILSYTIPVGGHANELLIGGYSDQASAYYWQKQLEEAGVDTTIVQR